ncbi:hypothetical protein [Ascidiimonas sp. W6]|uniref:hypothetical protein n=1 Tax=Ascidiimonas meishanensis TaxID=3128903 RepID=UPI0030EC4A5D
MRSKVRHWFNSVFSDDKHHALLQHFEDNYPGQLGYRVSESPIFITDNFKEQLLQASDQILEQVQRIPDEILSKATPSSMRVPGDHGRPHFMSIDFGVCANDKGELEPQLIEMQAFPSLFCYQLELGKQYFKQYGLEEEHNFLFNNFTSESYVDAFKKLIIEDAAPENVVILELHPEKQKTRIDFVLTEKYLGIKTVCLSKVIKEGRYLFYDKDGIKTPIHRIYNRVILDELLQYGSLSTAFKMQDEVEVTWVTHPDWFFKISKVILPLLDHPNVPKSYFADEFPVGEDLQNYVLKPLYSFAGQGVKLSPSITDIKNLKTPHDYILQKKVTYAPAFLDTNKELARAEIRMMYIWPKGAKKSVPAINLVRMTKSEMINVDHNKANTIFTGSSIALFAK